MFFTSDFTSLTDAPGLRICTRSYPPSVSNSVIASHSPSKNSGSVIAIFRIISTSTHGFYDSDFHTVFYNKFLPFSLWHHTVSNSDSSPLPVNTAIGEKISDSDTISLHNNLLAVNLYFHDIVHKKDVRHHHDDRHIEENPYMR